MLLNKNINNLSGGVSQQPDANRFDNQVESMENFMITEAQGLRRRNPTVLLDSTATAHHADTAIHSYSRGDGAKRYGITLCEHGLKVYDPDAAGTSGFEKTVNIVNTGLPNPITQWGSGTNWREDIRFLTVGDTTWILNTKQVVTNEVLDETVNATRAFYWIKKTTEIRYGDNLSSSDGYTYEVVVNGVTKSVNSPSSLDAIETLADAVNTIDGVTAVPRGSVLYMTGVTSFSSGDSFGNQASVGWRDSVPKLSDLPAIMDGFSEEEVGTLAITGTDKDNYNSYYIRWVDDGWKEVHKPNTERILNTQTMPAKLIQIDDNTFEFGFLREWEYYPQAFSYGDDYWARSQKGDEDTNPTPSFVGSTISNMFFFKNRLGFTAGENVILSEAGEYYNFFATTAMDVLDSDPIDASVDSNTVAIIRNVTVNSGAVTLWADDAQFLLAGGETLSPASTRISQTSSYACDSSISPIAIDNEVLFFNKKGEYLEVMTYAAASLQADKSSATSVSAHLPKYIHSTVDTAVVSKSHNMVFLFSTDEPREIYVYKYYNRGEEKVISAWSVWLFNEDLHGIEVLEDKLFLLAGTGDFLSLDLEPQDITDDFRDRGTTPFASTLEMSKFNAQTRQETQVINTPFYIKNMTVERKGNVNLDIINSERNRTTTVQNKHLDRKLFIGGHSDKVRIGFSTSANDGCEIDTLNIEGRLNVKSKNI